MIGPTDNRCGVCGQEGNIEPYSIVLCHGHAVLNRRLRSLEAGKQGLETDLTGRRAVSGRGDYKDGFKRRFAVVLEANLEQVMRDVTLTFEDVPIWGVEALFHRIHMELDRPDVEDVEAKLIIKYTGLDESQDERLTALHALWGLNLQLGTTETRALPAAKSHRC